MKNKTIIIFAFSLFFLLLSIGLNAQATAWEKDLGEPIKSYEFLQDGKLLFFTSEEFVWCYNSESGKNVWEMEIEDFEEDGISYLLGEMFLTNSDNKIQAYNAVNGNLIWENEYDGIDQEDFTSFEIVLNNGFFRYGEDHLGIDLNTGKELFRVEIDYWGDLVNLGTFNYSVLEKQKKMLVMEDDETATLIDIQTGEKVFSEEDFDINEDLIEKNLPWLYKSPNTEFLVFVLDDGAVAVNAITNKIIGKVKFDIDGSVNAILPTEVGCAVMGEDKFVHFNFKTEKITQLDFPADEMRTMKSYNISGKSILIISLKNSIAAINLSDGILLWQTPPDDETYEGYIHKYLPLQDENIVFVLNRPRLVSEDSGTYLYLMSMNGLTGKLNYKTTALLSKTAMSDFTRGLAKVISAGFASFIAVGTLGNSGGAAGQIIDMASEMMGYNNIGFEYQTFEIGDDILFLGKTKMNMLNPETRDEPGEGIVSINKKTGKLNYKTYVRIAEGMNDNELKYSATPLFVDNKLFVCGDYNLYAFDLKSGELLWQKGEDAGFISELVFIDGLLYTKFGTIEHSLALNKETVKVSTLFDEDPYGFSAYDALNGKKYWRVEMEKAPGILNPQFSIQNYFDDRNNRLYFSDEENIYALKLGKNGGSYDWTFNYDDNGFDEMEIEESYAVNSKWIGTVRKRTTTSYSTGGGFSYSVTTKSGGLDDEKSAKFLEDSENADITSTYTSWGNIYGVTAKRCLRVLFAKEKLLLIGANKISMLSASDSKILWETEWDYDPEEIQYVPKIVDEKLLFCADENLRLLNLLNGETVWESEESDDARFFLSPTNKGFFSINDEEIKGYKLSK